MSNKSKQVEEPIESKSSAELQKLLQGIQDIVLDKSIKLTEDEMKIAKNIVNYAQNNMLVAPFVEVDENGIRYDFKLDYGTKELLSDLSDEVVLDAFNDLLKTNFKLDKEINLSFTEYFKVLSSLENYFIRGDLSALITNGLEDEITNVVLVEVQAWDDKKIGKRSHDYGNNNLIPVTMKVKRVIDGKEVMVEEEVFVRPFEMIIYASTKFKQKKGVLRFNVTASHFESNGVERSGKNGDVTTYLIPYINIFQMTLKQLNKSKFFFLQAIYLYKYRQNKDLLKKESKIAEIASQIERNLEEKLSPEDFAVAIKQHRNLCVDICNIAQQNPDEYGKVCDDMLALKETFYDVTKKEGFVEAQIKMVLNMIKDNLSNEKISEYSEFTVEEIEKIRDEHSE